MKIEAQPMKKLLLVTVLVFTAYIGALSALDELQWSLRSSMIEAAENGDLEKARNLLRWRWFFKPHQALSVAAEIGRIDMVNLLLEEGVPADTVSLWKVIEAGHMEILALLITHGADLSSAAPLSYASGVGNKEMVVLLLNANAEVNACESNFNGLSKIEAVIISGGNYLVRGDSSGSVSAQGHKGPLRWNCYPVPLGKAIDANQIEIATMLINANTNVLATSNKGSKTLLDIARDKGTPEMIQLLETALELPLASNVINAAQEGDWERLLKVVELGAEVNQPETSHDETYGWTALMYAANQGLVEIANTLILAGADVNYISPESVTALSLAETKEHDKVIKLLIAAGAKL